MISINTYETLLITISKQEQTLQFNSFNHKTALDLGLLLIEKANKEQKSITIDITKHGQQLFHYACEGTSPDQDEWIRRKNKVVNRFYTSSLYLGTRLKSLNTSIEEKYLLSPLEYAPYGGAFPIILKGTGVIGTITISGLKQEEDHQFIVDVLTLFLNVPY